MGNNNDSLPKNHKTLYYDENSNIEFVNCEMKGWRDTMEDASLFKLNFLDNKDWMLFGIFDGHGGNLISNFCAKNFQEILKNNILKYMHKLNKNYKTLQDSDIQHCLIESFLKLDELLKSPKINSILQEIETEISNNPNSKLINDNIFDSKFKLIPISQFSKLKAVFDSDSCFLSSTNKSSQLNKSFKSLDINLNNFPKSNSCITCNNVEDNLNKTNNENISENISCKNNSDELLNEKSDNSFVNSNLTRIDSEYYLKNLKKSKGTISEMIKKKELVSKRMGTTANIVLMTNDKLYVANVGDSLAIMYKNKKAIRLNTEHKPNLKVEFDRIINSGETVVNNRVGGKLNMSRSIGDFIFKSNKKLKNYEQAVIAHPEVNIFDLSSEVDFIILACDGVWDCVEDQKFCLEIDRRLKQKKQEMHELISDLFDLLIAKNKMSKLIIII